MMRAAIATLAAVLAASCGGSSTTGGNQPDAGRIIDAPLVIGDAPAAGGDGGQVACIPGLQTLSVSPATSNVTLDGSAPAPINFTASGRTSSGDQAIAGSRLAWSATRADDTPPGSVVAGVFTPFASAGGTVTVTATDGCKSATATVTLLLVTAIGSPAPGADWTGTPVSLNAPLIVYPNDGTRFPRNIYRTLFQWRTAGFNEFRLSFVGPGSRVTVYTNGAHDLCAKKTPPAGCWEADEAAWNAIASSNAGATVTLTVDALDRSTTSPTVRRSAAISIGFSRRDVRGAIFYWSTTSKGIRRANISESVPENYIAGVPPTTYPPNDQVKCVACHVVSRDGKYLAGGVSASSGNSLWIMGVTVAAPPDPLVKKIANTGGHGFATFSPDDSRMVAAWGDRFWLLDRATGAYLADVPAGGAATHPDWSPDNRLVFATGKGDNPTGASLKVMPYLGGTSWGPSSTLAPAAGLSNLFPMFSNDSQWVAYARGKGGSHGDVTLQLFIVSASGGTPVELVAANRLVSNRTTDGKHQNSEPTWAPTGDFYWIAFNSQREYGVVLTAGTQQIWVAAVDPDKLAAGGADPSFPAFRLQFQGLDEDNHRAFWTQDVRYPEPTPPPPMDAGPCIAHNAPCDPLSIAPCCVPSDRCDTSDDGQTYNCIGLQ